MDAGAAPWRPGPRGTETRRGRRGARAWAAGPSRGISPAAQVGFVQLPWKQAGSRGPARPCERWDPKASHEGEGGPAFRFQGISAATAPCGSLDRDPPTERTPGLVFLVALLEAGLAALAPRGSGAQGSATPSGSARIPPTPPTACPGFPVRTAARSPLVRQPKALFPSYFCTTSSPATNPASKKTDAGLELRGAPRKRPASFPSGSRSVGPGELPQAPAPCQVFG